MQCPHRKKVGDFCGIHAKSSSVTRFDQIIQNVVANLEGSGNINDPPPGGGVNVAAAVVPSTEAPKTKAKTTSSGLKGKFKLFKGKIKIKKQHLYTYIDLRDLSIDDINSSAVNHSLKRYGLSNSGNLKEKVTRLREYLEDQYQAELMAVMGPARENRQACNNETDFYQFDTVAEIPDYYFFSFKCQDDKLYGCDVRSMHRYLKVLKSDDQKEFPNPYNRLMLSERTLDLYQQKLDFLERYQFDLDHPEICFMTPKQKLRSRALEVFQLMYHEGYPVNHEWLLNLPRHKLIEFYEKVEDIWNYRLELSNSQKKKIVGDNVNLFNKSEAKGFKDKPTDDLRSMMVDKIEIMATKGESKSDRVSGMMYILTGLTEVCPKAAESLPALAYGAGLG